MSDDSSDGGEKQEKSKFRRGRKKPGISIKCSENVNVVHRLE